MSTAATFIITYTAHSVAFALMAFGAVRFLRRHASLRCTLWKAALVAPLLTTSVAVAGSDKRPFSVTAMAGRLIPITPARIDVDVQEIRGKPISRVERVRDPVGTATAVFFTVFALIGVVRVAIFLFRRGRFLNAVHRSSTTVPIATRGFLNGIPVVETGLVDVPVALATGVVALPRRFSDAGSERSRYAILLHERAHIERGDPFWIDIARLITSATPWQPFNRVIADRLEIDVELAADSLAISLGAEPRGLVEGLAHFAARTLSPVPSGASLVRAESPLVRRARCALAGTRPHGPRPVVIGALMGSFLSLAAAMASLPPASPGLATARSLPPRAAQFVEIDVREEQPTR